MSNEARERMQKSIRARSTNDMNDDFVELLHDHVIKLQDVGIPNERILQFLDLMHISALNVRMKHAHS